MDEKMKDLPTNTMTPIIEALAGRLNARSALMERVQRLRREADRLERLANTLPMEMHPDADEALWDLVTRR